MADNDDQTIKLQVSNFLKEFKRIATGQGILIIRRAENEAALIDLGLTLGNARSIILSLSVEDYSSGPEKDRDRPGEVWVFGKMILWDEVYIKLKIVCDGKKEAVCISFHKAKFPMVYPFK